MILPNLRVPLLDLLRYPGERLRIAFFHPFLHCLTFHALLTSYFGKDSTVGMTAEIKFCQFHIFGCR